MTAAQALKLYRDSLTEFEQSEILEYPQASTRGAPTREFRSFRSNPLSPSLCRASLHVLFPSDFIPPGVDCAVRLLSSDPAPEPAHIPAPSAQVWFTGASAAKVRGNVKDAANNNGYDDERGDYVNVPRDHIAYRYEVLQLLGKGSFGQVREGMGRLLHSVPCACACACSGVRFAGARCRP